VPSAPDPSAPTYTKQADSPKRYPAARVSTDAGNSSTVAEVYAPANITGPRYPDAAIRSSRSCTLSFKLAAAAAAARIATAATTRLTPPWLLLLLSAAPCCWLVLSSDVGCCTSRWSSCRGGVAWVRCLWRGWWLGACRAIHLVVVLLLKGLGHRHARPCVQDTPGVCGTTAPCMFWGVWGSCAGWGGGSR
jgi:hypothetical protein